jgi:D-sedoheptulose 7-phosphate isomerase
MTLDKLEEVQYSVLMKSDDFMEYTDRISLALNKIDETSVKKVLFLINQKIESNARIWIAGNGGSAATASHFATDLSRCKNSKNQPVKGLSLCDNSGLITAIGNDYGYEFIFSRQLSNLASNGDLLIALTASGKSKNILEVLGWAKNNQVETIALTGFGGGEANKLADISIHVPTDIGDYGVAEDAHSIICHFLSSQFRD